MGNRRCISALGYEDGKSVNILWGKILWVWKFLLILHSQSGLDALVAWHGECENSSVGRARPCQGRGRGFESRFSLQETNAESSTPFLSTAADVSSQLDSIPNM